VRQVERMGKLVVGVGRVCGGQEQRRCDKVGLGIEDYAKLTCRIWIDSLETIGQNDCNVSAADVGQAGFDDIRETRIACRAWKRENIRTPDRVPITQPTSAVSLSMIERTLNAQEHSPSRRFG
jgi:hypothetical protein